MKTSALVRFVLVLITLFTVLAHAEPVASFNIAGKKPEIRIASLCASTSTNLPSSQRFAVAGMAGISVFMNRAGNPAAWYLILIDTPSWQLWDGVTTTFHSWMGSVVITNPATAGEYGPRMVIHSGAPFPVSQYWCRVISTSTNYSSAFFPVGINSQTGAEIPFGPNFPGIYFGTNGILESQMHPVTLVWVQGGDDVIYTAGQLPSSVPYDYWYRFGATVSITITSPTGYDPLRGEFSSAVRTLTAQLVIPAQGGAASLVSSTTVSGPGFVGQVTNGEDDLPANGPVVNLGGKTPYTVSASGGGEQIVASRTIVSAQPSLEVKKEGENEIRLGALGGQTLNGYQLLSHTNLAAPLSTWTNLFTLNYGQQVVLPVQKNEPKRFYALEAAP